MILKTLVVICMLSMSLSPAFAETAPIKSARSVEIYVTDWCHYCRDAQSYMKSRGIAFTAYDIEKDSAANRRYMELGGGGVPILVIGSKKMYGFSKEKFEYILKNEP
jgi:glutaredoxin